MVNKLKYIIIGNSSTGKTSLVNMFCNEEFEENYTITIGVDYQVKTLMVDDKQYQIQLWDTAGQEKFNSIIKTYYRNADCCIFMYDVTNRNSFISMSKWVNDFKLNCNNIRSVLLLIGNKIDNRNPREQNHGSFVSKDEGLQFAVDNNMLFSEISVKNNINVMKTFINSIKYIDKNIDLSHNSDMCDIPIETLLISDIEDDMYKHKKNSCC